MRVKTILVPVERNDLISGTLETASIFARVFDSYVEGFPLGPALDAFVSAEAIGSMVIYPSDVNQDDKSADDARRLFEEAMQRGGLRNETGPGSLPSYRWNDRKQLGDGFLGSYSRVFDLVIVGRPGTTATSPRMGTLESALFESGRPILIVPPGPPRQFGGVVTIAWNGSTETSRAIALAMPILRKAKRTVVLTIEGAGVPGPEGDQVARHLERNGVACETTSVKRGTRSVGAAIVEEAAGAGSDLIVKGAFTQSRLRQLIFGGATNHLINQTTLPVLMAH
jgi:nucleotide-binding universal stress UspA family protein